MFPIVLACLEARITINRYRFCVTVGTGATVFPSLCRALDVIWVADTIKNAN